MMRLHDISVPISERMPTYPGDAPVSRVAITRIARGDLANTSQLSLGTHTGTHVDPPAHFIPGAPAIDELALETLIGPARLYDLAQVERIGVRELAALDITYPSERLLFKTRNSHLWADSTFRQDFTYLTPDGAQWLVDHGVRLVGIDYLSLERYGAEEPLAHLILLRAGVVVVEGLNLSGVDPGHYTLICLPIKIAGGDGAPARAVLIEE